MAARTPDQCAVLDGEGMESAQYCAAQYGVTELAGPKIYNALKWMMLSINAVFLSKKFAGDIKNCTFVDVKKHGGFSSVG